MIGKADTSILDHLERTREWLSDPAHWANYCSSGELHDPHCVGNALVLFRPPGTSCWTPAHIALCRTIGVNPHEPLELFAWNDAPERTHDDVLAALDRAIADERARLAEHCAGAQLPSVDREALVA